MNTLFRWVDEGERMRWWEARCYADYARRQMRVTVVGLHWFVCFFWWLEWKWAHLRNRPSWIDRLVRGALDHQRRALD
jgi:hypothetical protein